MILIAIVAWPLALFARRPRPVEYPERAAWQALSERRVNKPQADAARARDAAATKGGTSAPKDERTMR